MTLLAQLTDTHVLDPLSDETRYVDNNGRLAEAVMAINAESPQPDAVLATGDLVNWGHQPEYDQLATLLEPLDAPVLALPGNHDDRARIRAAFPATPWADTEHASWQSQVGNVCVIGLDSTIPGQPGAEFDATREHWLAEALATVNHSAVTESTATASGDDSGQSQAVLALHHPPFQTGIGWMDKSGFKGVDRLVAMLRAHGGIDRLICGHLHRPISSAVAGIPAQVGLSTIQHVGLDLEPDAPITLINDPAGFMLHQFTGATWVTHTRYIATGERPYTPDWA